VLGSPDRADLTRLEFSMRDVLRPRHVAISVLALALAAACTGSDDSARSPRPSNRPVSVTVWVYASGRELNDFRRVLREARPNMPWINVVVRGGKSPTDIQTAIDSGTPPDVAIEPLPDDAASYCSSGAWIDLRPLASADRIELSSVIVPSALSYSSYGGRQCALPMLTDAIGLYYNTAMFRAAGIDLPPRTFSELEADAEALTTARPNGSLKVVGFDPLNSFYDNWALDYGIYSGAAWYDQTGRSVVGSDPSWTELLRWQKSFVDWYGYRRLASWYRRIGGADGSFTPSNAFETGRVAMMLDGEWRVAFIAANHARLHYATAPFPVADYMAANYGEGQIGGDIIGIPSGVSDVADAWAVVKYLALDTQAEERLGELLKNIPTTFQALQDPTLSRDPHFAPFLSIFANPHSAYRQITPLATNDANLLLSFVTKYLAGSVSDLQGGLRKVAVKIDASSGHT
jgi:multiple sugar transport system substrate-binding protein